MTGANTGGGWATSGYAHRVLDILSEQLRQRIRSGPSQQQSLFRRTTKWQDMSSFGKRRNRHKIPAPEHRIAIRAKTGRPWRVGAGVILMSKEHPWRLRSIWMRRKIWEFFLWMYRAAAYPKRRYRAWRVMRKMRLLIKKTSPFASPRPQKESPMS